MRKLLIGFGVAVGVVAVMSVLATLFPSWLIAWPVPIAAGVVWLIWQQKGTTVVDIAGKTVNLAKVAVLFCALCAVLQLFLAAATGVSIEDLIAGVSADPGLLLRPTALGQLFLPQLLVAVIAAIKAVGFMRSERKQRWLFAWGVCAVLALIYVSTTDARARRNRQEARRGEVTAQAHNDAVHSDVSTVLHHFHAKNLPHPRITIPIGKQVDLYHKVKVKKADLGHEAKEVTFMERSVVAAAGSQYVVSLDQNEVYQDSDTHLLYLPAVQMDNPAIKGVFLYDDVEPYIFAWLREQGQVLPSFAQPTAVAPAQLPNSEFAGYVPTETDEVEIRSDDWVVTKLWTDDRDVIFVKPDSGRDEDVWRVKIRSGWEKPCPVKVNKDTYEQFFGSCFFVGKNFSPKESPIRLKLAEGAPVRAKVTKMVPRYKVTE